METGVRTIQSLLVLFIAIGVPHSGHTADLRDKPSFQLLKIPRSFDPAQRLLKWGSLELGTPARVSYAFAPTDIEASSDLGDCGPVKALNVPFADGSSAEDAKRVFHEAFKAWESVTGVEFVPVEDPLRADILIGMSPRSNSITHAHVGLSMGADSSDEVVRLTRASLCLDEEELWTTAPSHRIAGRDKYLSLYLVVAHEIGHILGLDHPRDEGQLMGRKILETTRGMGEGDTEGIRILYGRPR